jgi:PAS domain
MRPTRGPVLGFPAGVPVALSLRRGIFSMKNSKADISRKAPIPKPRLSHRPTSPESTTSPVVGIGASAGGLEALTELLRYLPEKSGMGLPAGAAPGSHAQQRIRRFTPPAEKLMNFCATDIGRRLAEIRPNLVGVDLDAVSSATPSKLPLLTSKKSKPNTTAISCVCVLTRPGTIRSKAP